MALALLVGCGDDDPEPTNEHEAPEISFWTRTHDDGTTYRCLYIYVDGPDAGGPAMWCERLRESGTA